MEVSMSLITKLLEAESALPKLLGDESIWQSLFVDYHPPFVDRLWCRWQEYRLYLHRIHPCSAHETLFHPHPWPSAMRVVSGEYEMRLGFGTGMIEPPVAATLILGPGSLYEMAHPDSWHSVRPLSTATLSVMLTGVPWDRPSHKSNKTLGSLPAEDACELLQIFKHHYR